jgi:hypothetical protein
MVAASRALVAVMVVAAPVVTSGALTGPVVNALTAPALVPLVPLALIATIR